MTVKSDNTNPDTYVFNPMRKCNFNKVRLKMAEAA